MVEIDMNRLPRHIAIIMDGNGRWATQRGLSRSLGHQAGVDTVRRITSECSRLGIEYLTLYTFSTENWKRPADEVAALMGLVMTSLEDEIFMKNNVKLRVVGDMQRIPDMVRERLNESIERTSVNTGTTMVLALSYSSRWEITEATRQIAQKVAQGDITPSDINEEMLTNNMATAFMPDPDLLIRTGGELRISNYLLWQAAYSELYFCDTYWPDFSEDDFRKAIASYQQRQRRYGKTEQQVEQDAPQQ